MTASHLDRLMAIFGVSFPHIRFMLDVTGSIISGSVALLAMFPGGGLLFEPSHLDVFTTQTQYMHLIRYFYIAAGYAIDTSLAHEEYFRTGNGFQIFTLRRPGSTTTIQIIIAIAGNPMLPLFGFYITPLMNLINGKGAHLVYLFYYMALMHSARYIFCVCVSDKRI